jgi:small subunit ribosomal protein S2
MISARSRELKKIKRNLEGIRTLTRLPGALIIIDVHREHNAVREAKKLGIPTVCLIDTDSDPDFADIPIPGNDDAIRAIDVVLAHLADAVEEGKKARRAPEAPAESEAGPRRRSRRSSAQRGGEGAAGEGPGREGESEPAAVPAHAGGDRAEA